MSCSTNCTPLVCVTTLQVSLRVEPHTISHIVPEREGEIVNKGPSEKRDTVNLTVQISRTKYNSEQSKALFRIIWVFAVMVDDDGRHIH